MNQASAKTQNMVKLALFAGIIVVLSMTPLGYIPLGVIKATTIHIPVILGSILLGWKAGAVLGGIFGLTSLVVNTITPSLTSFVFTPFYSLDGSGGSLWSLVVCFVPRILVGILPYFIYRGIQKLHGSDIVSLGIAGFLGSMTNTLLVMNLIYLLFGERWGAAKQISSDLIYKTILGVIAANGIPEAIVAAVITAAVGKVLIKVLRMSSPRR
ncbi:ECF transporter S component [uncultured Negativibacillus sp.]|uniref:ECF transporter S component n=1 Tax=uncultured Negativibacillus sp. TaxID=1980696 RepID=UPI0025CC8449|nr:ECF transporter S component [uncultured Negativibacillus sp.]